MNPIYLPYWGSQIMIEKSFKLFGLDIAFYGVLIALGMILGACVAFYEAKRTGQKLDDYVDYTIIGIICAIVGARLYFVIFEWSNVTAGAKNFGEYLLAIINVRQGGLAIYGAIIAAAICMIIFCKRRKIRVLQMVDTVVLGLLIGQIIGRWGNFINREAFGCYNFQFLGWTFDASKVPFLYNLRMHIPITDINNAAVYTESMVVDSTYVECMPTFLVESVGNLIIFAVLMIFRDKKKFYGETGCRYLIGYGILRFFVEGFRTDQLKIGSVAVSQVLSLLLVIAGLLIVIIVRVRMKGKPAAIDPIPTKEELKALEEKWKAEDEQKKADKLAAKKAKEKASSDKDLMDPDNEDEDQFGEAADSEDEEGFDEEDKDVEPEDEEDSDEEDKDVESEDEEDSDEEAEDSEPEDETEFDEEDSDEEDESSEFEDDEDDEDDEKREDDDAGL